MRPAWLSCAGVVTSSGGCGSSWWTNTWTDDQT
jgi:hypothetical protein